MLEQEYNWEIESQIGDVPKQKCRTQHLVDGRARRYCHAIIYKNASTVIQILEIELTIKTNKKGVIEVESLSTLFFRARDTDKTYLKILDELMSSDKDIGLSAMSWKRKLISKRTIIKEYLGHPDKKIKSERAALDSWVARAAEKVEGM